MDASSAAMVASMEVRARLMSGSTSVLSSPIICSASVRQSAGVESPAFFGVKVSSMPAVVFSVRASSLPLPPLTFHSRLGIELRALARSAAFGREGVSHVGRTTVNEMPCTWPLRSESQ